VPHLHQAPGAHNLALVFNDDDVDAGVRQPIEDRGEIRVREPRPLCRRQDARRQPTRSTDTSIRYCIGVAPALAYTVDTVRSDSASARTRIDPL
jgi:hypothetical protein